MALERLVINKRWGTGNATDVRDYNAISDPLVAWAERTNQNLKQIGLDLNSTTYDFNNTGRATQTSSVIGRLNALDLSQASPGTRNLALDFTSVAIVTLSAADTTALSSTNIGYVGFTSTTDATGVDAGKLLTRNVTANISITLTGAHWGLGTLGDYTDVPLWIYLIDTGSTTVLGISMEGGKRFVASSDVNTVATSITTRAGVLTNAAVGANSNCMELGFIFADFDDTGNAGGEDYWTAQRAVGDIHFGQARHLREGSFYF